MVMVTQPFRSPAVLGGVVLETAFLALLIARLTITRPAMSRNASPRLLAFYAGVSTAEVS